MDSFKSEEPLSQALGAWQVKPARHPQFRAVVWARMTRTGNVATQPWSLYARKHLAAVAGTFVLALALGAWVGREQAHARVAADSRRMAEAYVQGLDARAMHMP